MVFIYFLNVAFNHEQFQQFIFCRFNKLVKDVAKFIQSQEKGPWPQNKISALDRALGEAIRILDKKVSPIVL